MTDVVRYQSLCRINTLRRAWRGVSRGKSEHLHGADNVSLRDFESNLESNLQSIRKRLAGRDYEFGTIRPRAIPKGAGKTGKRPLGIHNHDDRIVQRALYDLLVHRFDVRQLDCSFGFRKSSLSDGNSGVTAAARRVLDETRGGKTWVFEADIKKFFDNVDRHRLAVAVSGVTRSSDITALLIRAFNAVVDLDLVLAMKPGERELFGRSDLGLPQGGVVSPMLANHYLLPLDYALVEGGFAPVRYADDFVVLCRSEKEARSAADLAKTKLDELGLEMHPLTGEQDARSRIVPYNDGFEFLGLRFEGQYAKPSKSAIDSYKTKIDGIVDDDGPHGFWQRARDIDGLQRGWTTTFSDLEVYRPQDAFIQVNAHVCKRVARLLHQCGLSKDVHISHTKVRKLGIKMLPE